jgi:hypothetical protein
MRVMKTKKSFPARVRPAHWALALTLGACLVALLLRTPLQARYWAWRVAAAEDDATRDQYLGALASAGAAGSWGINALLSDERAEVRQYGVLALQHVTGSWSDAQLLVAIDDPDADIRRLAAAGLGMQSRPGVVPTLVAVYRDGDAAAAEAACLALAHVGSDEAIAALNALAGGEADVGRRAAVLDALRMVGRPACVPGLLAFLDDRRDAAVAPLFAALQARAVALLVGQGYRAAETQPAAAPEALDSRAARALQVITGVDAGFDLEGSADERAAARATWARWYEEWAGE